MLIRDLFWTDDTESFAEMFHVEQSKAGAFAKQVNALTKKYNEQFSGRPLNPDELGDLANVLRHPAMFLHRVYGEIKVESMQEIILVYSLAIQKYNQIKASIPLDMMNLLIAIWQRK